jgi:hypothetical protein
MLILDANGTIGEGEEVLVEAKQQLEYHLLVFAICMSTLFKYSNVVIYCGNRG